MKKSTKKKVIELTNNVPNKPVNEIDNTPKENIEYENKFNFINDKQSPYSG